MVRIARARRSSAKRPPRRDGECVAPSSISQRLINFVRDDLSRSNRLLVNSFVKSSGQTGYSFRQELVT